MSWRPVPACPEAVPALQRDERRGSRATWQHSCAVEAWNRWCRSHGYFFFVFLDGFLQGFGKTCRNPVLVGGFNLPLWKMMEWVTVGMMTFPIWWESHNPFMFQSPPISNSVDVCIAFAKNPTSTYINVKRLLHQHQIYSWDDPAVTLW